MPGPLPEFAPSWRLLIFALPVVLALVFVASRGTFRFAVFQAAVLLAIADAIGFMLIGGAIAFAVFGVAAILFDVSWRLLRRVTRASASP